MKVTELILDELYKDYPRDIFTFEIGIPAKVYTPAFLKSVFHSDSLTNLYNDNYLFVHNKIEDKFYNIPLSHGIGIEYIKMLLDISFMTLDFEDID